MNYLKLYALFCIAVFLFSCKNGSKDQNAKRDSSPVSVEVIIAGQEDVKSSIEANETVISDDMIALHAEISGRITYLTISDGANVSECTLLAQINDADLQAELEQGKV